MKEEENLLQIMQEAKVAVNNKDVLKLKELSNRTIHSVSMYKDTDNLSLAIIVYSLGKIIERQDEKNKKKCGTFCMMIVRNLSKAISAVEEKDEKSFSFYLGEIMKSVSKQPGEMRDYIQDVFRKARINKASKIYEHGISMEQTAKLLGITLWELAGYSGQRKEEYSSPEEKSIVKKRIKLAMKMFE